MKFSKKSHYNSHLHWRRKEGLGGVKEDYGRKTPMIYC